MTIRKLNNPTVCHEAHEDEDEHCIAHYSLRVAPGKLGVWNLCPKHLRGVLTSQKELADNQHQMALRTVERAKTAIHHAERNLVTFSELEQKRWNNHHNEKETP